MSMDDAPSIWEKDMPMAGETAAHFHIGGRHMEQGHAPHASQYFVMGNNRIVIREHFRDDGKPLEHILEKVILDAEKHPETA